LTSYDVLVIGNDPGGVVAAQMAAAGGLSVAIVAQNFEHPDRVLATVYDVAIEVASGIISQPQAWARFLNQSRERSEQAQRVAMEALSALGVTCYPGDGQIIAPGRVRIEANSQASEVAASKIILASGSSPRALAGAPEDNRIIPAEKINQMTECPVSALVVGDTVEAFEAAWALQTLGCQVKWVFFAEYPLSGFEDADFEQAIAHLQGLGVVLYRQSKVRSVAIDPGELKIDVDDRARGVRQEVLASCLVTAIGRRPRGASLGLEHLNVVLDKRGHIQVDNSMLTGEPNVYAVGDLLPTLPWPHVAAAEGRVAAQHLLGKPVSAIRYQHIPLSARGWPFLCAIGLTSREAEREGFLVQLFEVPVAEFVQHGSHVEASGRVTIVFDQEAQHVLGAHICGDHAPSLIMAVLDVLQLPEPLFAEETWEREAVEFAANVFREAIKRAAGD
jgi:dihydrolipoamide dehydrogenase